MSDAVLIKAEKREKLGTRTSRVARANGKMPAVVYGHKQEPVSVAVDAHELLMALQHHHRLFDLDLDGSKETVMVKEVQYDYLGDTIIHIDFARVDIHEKVHVHVEVVLKGTAKGTSEGGVLEQRVTDIELECEAMNIPDEVRVNVSELGVGEVLTAGDIELPAGSTLVTDATTPIAACSVVVEKAEEEGEEEAGSDEPEVIGRKPEDETEE